MSSSKSFLNKNGIKILLGIIAISIIVFAYSKLSPKQFACVYESDKLSYSTLKIDRFWKRMTFYPVEPSLGRHEGIKMGPYAYQRTKRGDHYRTRPFGQRKLREEEKKFGTNLSFIWYFSRHSCLVQTYLAIINYL